MKRMNNRSPFQPQAKANYRIENKTNKEPTIYIYDEISYWGISAEEIIQDIDALDDSLTLHIRYNTPGGNIFDGLSIFNAIRRYKGKTISHIDGLAASISSVMALASDEVRIAENATFMIHRPWSIVIGMEEDFLKEADILHQEGDIIAKEYITKSKKSEKEILDLMKAETWYIGGQKAVDAGFADFVEDEDGERKESLKTFDLSVFANVPDELKDIKREFTERDAEKALRDAGCSRGRSQEILAKGFKGDPNEREAQEEARLKAEREAQVAEEAHLREAEEAKVKKGSTEDLLMQAEIMAPTK